MPLVIVLYCVGTVEDCLARVRVKVVAGRRRCHLSLGPLPSRPLPCTRDSRSVSEFRFYIVGCFRTDPFLVEPENEEICFRSG